MDTKKFYDRLYDGGRYQDGPFPKTLVQKACIQQWMKRVQLASDAIVLEVGAACGDLHDVHPGWHGIEYSDVAVSRGRARHGEELRLRQGSITDLDVPDGSVDFLFTFATLEHVPQIDAAFREMQRVIAPNGVLVLAPAWNCRPWTVEKLKQRRYADLRLSQQIGKSLIPIRNNLLFRMAVAAPSRMIREIHACVAPARLEFRRLYPDPNLLEQYPYEADDDAFVSMDAHAALIYLIGRGFESLSHPTAWRRLACRGEPVVVQRKKSPH